MTLTTDLATLELWNKQLPRVAMNVLGASGSPMYVMDFIMVGAIKRTMSLASGLKSMVEIKNMVCARALLRLQIDTLSRLRAYTYVKDPESLAKAVLAGDKLDKHKSDEGQELRDGYLVKRLSLGLPWVEKTYRETSGYVHFSERQFFDTVQTIRVDELTRLDLTVSATDDKYPEESWIEVVACFNELTQALVETADSYAERKNAA